jgi:hypothetical protein
MALSRFIPSLEFMEQTMLQLVSVGIAAVPPFSSRFAAFARIRSSMFR